MMTTKQPWKGHLYSGEWKIMLQINQENIQSVLPESMTFELYLLFKSSTSEPVEKTWNQYFHFQNVAVEAFLLIPPKIKYITPVWYQVLFELYLIHTQPIHSLWQFCLPSMQTLSWC